MRQQNVWAWMLLVTAGCGLTPALPDVVTPQPKPVTPDITILQKTPAEAYWKMYAVWVDTKMIATPQQLAQNARQLNLVKLLSDSDFKSLGDTFPGMLKDTRPLTKDDAAKLRSMK